MLRNDAVGYDLVVVGTSWGGLAALRTFVGGLPASFHMAVTLVQHRHRDSDHLLCTLLQERTPLLVHEIEDKMPLEPGCIYVAPPNYHTLVEPGHFSLSTEAPVRFSRPSIDVTFQSAAESYGRRTIGIVLTGANDDGSDGLRYIVERGGVGLVQDPASAESAAMPAAALRAVPTALKMLIGDLVKYVVSLPAGVPARETR